MFNVVFIVISFIALGVFFVAIEIHDAPLMADDEMTVISSSKHDHDEHHSQKAA